ncbi:MAG: hypothetical protein WBC06_06315 [Chitinophagaceae bacterium]
MKKINVLITAFIVVSGFAACNDSATQAEKDATNLNKYVDSVENLTPVYTAENWSQLNDGYQVRVTLTDKSNAELSASEKEKLADSKKQYEILKNTYEAKIAASETQQNNAASTPDYRQVLRNSLFGEGMIGTDLNFGFVTAANLLKVYRSFVNTVQDNRNVYTREDWDEIKVLYEALDTRKNTVEKDLPKGDNLDIAGLKIKFATIKGTHRGGTKGQENKDAKE